MIDANAKALLEAGIFPKPTDGNQFIGGNNVPTNVREEIVRIDHQLNDKLSVFGHYVQENVTQTYGSTLWTGSVPTVGDTLTSPSYSAVVHTMHTVRPDLLNEFAFNYNGNRNGIVPNGIINSTYSFNRVFPGPNTLNRNPSIICSDQPALSMTLVLDHGTIQQATTKCGTTCHGSRAGTN